VGNIEHTAVAAFTTALDTGVSRAAAFEEALTVWRAQYPEHSEFRAVADLATAIRALAPSASADAMKFRRVCPAT
jgi:hypothetical protein